MATPPPAVITTGAFEELRQQVTTLTQLLSQRNSHPFTPTSNGDLMAAAQARAPQNIPDNGVGTSGVPPMTAASRAVTIESGELSRIIQEGIAAGLAQKSKGTTCFTPSCPLLLKYCPTPFRIGSSIPG